jgi:hypothetical protein
MVSIDTFRKLALSFPDTEEQPHFNIPSFRVKKKIFATVWEKENKAMLKLSLISQSVFCSYNTSIFYPVPRGWGKQGATFVDLGKVRKDMFKDALATAYNDTVIKKKTKK